LQNTFAEKLGPYGFDPFVMLVVDLMHEFELGVWKAIFAHLVRLLYAVTPGGRMVTELDRRYIRLRNYNSFLTVSQIPTDPNVWSGNHPTFLLQCF
jgi:hypothetical protein